MARLLDRLTLGNSTGTLFVRLWDKVCTQIETIFGDQQSQITAIADLYAQLALAVADIVAAQAAADAAAADAATAQSTANTATTNAATAQTTADNVNKNDKNTASATVPTSILTATDAGADVTIGVLGHDRQYGDGTSVTLNAVASAVTGLAYSTLYAVYYDDTGYSGGTKTYHATTTLKTAQPEKVSGRHYCGQITTPAAAGAPVTGGGATSPSGSGPYP